MTYLSIIEKLKILFNTLIDFEFIFIFIILLLIFTLLYVIKKLSIKKYIVILLLSFIGVFGISIFSNYEILSNTFDNFFTIFFSNIYFPSIYVYISVLIISFIVFIVSIFNDTSNKIYKVINSIMFVINNLLFVIILNIIAKNNIDIFSYDSLYTNTSLVAVLELSMGLFILWILSLITVYITNVICIKISSKKINNEVINEETVDPILDVGNYNISNVNPLSNDVTSICVENTFIENKDVVIENITNEMIVNETSNDYVTFNDILNGCIPVNYYDNDNVICEYNLVDPQSVYENNYNKARDEIVFNDINLSLENDTKLSVEELTKIEKEKVREERLSINTISLNDLIDEDDSIMENNVHVLDVDSVAFSNGVSDYDVNDYKKIIKMLTEIKSYSNGSNINIDDAVAIGLINNYSVDDCMKFKSILENNLN